MDLNSSSVLVSNNNGFLYPSKYYPNLNEAVRRSREIIQTGFDTHGSTPSTPRIGISFNGGKDSVVMLQLILDTVGCRVVQQQTIVFFLEEAHEFPELIAFRTWCLTHPTSPYVGLKFVSVPLSPQGGPPQALRWLLQQHPSLEAVFLGTRVDDPSAKWQGAPVAPTTAGWPRLVRYCPVFHWKYSQIWAFTLGPPSLFVQRATAASGLLPVAGDDVDKTHEADTKKVPKESKTMEAERKRPPLPFCSLYAEGYTSLGSPLETRKNRSLLLVDSGREVSFDDERGLPASPAWELKDHETERSGRVEAGRPHL